MNASAWPRFFYRGKVSRVLDGDTVAIHLDLGLDVYHEVTLRLADVNAPEVVGPERAAGLAAKAWLTDHAIGRDVYVQTLRDKRSFVRYVALVYLPDDVGTLESFSDALVAAGHAEWSYRT